MRALQILQLYKIWINVGSTKQWSTCTITPAKKIKLLNVAHTVGLGPIYTVRLYRMRQAYGRLTTVVYVTKNVVRF